MSIPVNDIPLEELLKQYQGRALSQEEISSYERWSLDFFHNKAFVNEPNLQMTLQLDITEALKTYKDQYNNVPEASFTAYLMWHLVQTMKSHPAFRYRKIGDQWYLFDNLPLFSPIAIGGDIRFTEITVDNVAGDPPKDFFKNYRLAIKESKNRDAFSPLPPSVWATAHFVGNLPNLQFTGFSLHTPAKSSGRPYFYFGKRYNQEERQFIPLLITFDHSNLDPFLLSAFMADFEKNIQSP
ncbi:CatA-like O-acetyltransferase [Persicobacter diffluens]|uniref:Chloramphenicol acetyltransferase n=1 Tax=Persicobacter diffluens TaxID=981 RepID=A0AAN4W2K3_9BACT|nr:hypothetical protein PEDI_40050 [Persicobacter diffluens]